MKGVEVDIDVNRVIEAGRLEFDETHNQILRRLLSIDTGPVVPRVGVARSSGAYSTVIGKTPVEANGLKELLRRVILLCAKIHPGFVDELSRMPTPRGRFIVARTPEGLYPHSRHLAGHAERLDADWWYDNNVGRDQVASYFRKFAILLRLPQVPTIQKRSEKSMLTAEDLGL